jgi:hypothetical protein
MNDHFIRRLAAALTDDPDIIESKPVIAPPAAPPNPSTRPPQRKDKPSPTPFRPPKPSKLPKPKAYLLEEDFEGSAHPGTVGFWKDIRRSEHPYGKHPLMAMYGYEKAEKAFGHSLERMREIFPRLRNSSPQEITQAAPDLAMEAFMEVARAEAPYARELIEIAKKAVAQVWGVPIGMLNAMLTRDVGGGDDGDAGPEEEDLPEREGAADELRGQINKRITMNTLTQGAAVHNMATIHHVVSEQLNALNPQLLDIYQRFSAGATHFYWIIDLVNITSMALQGQTIGTASVEYDGDEPVVVAKAVNFPVLVQELVKGVMELLSHHGLEGLGPEELSTVYRHADKLTDEPWLIQVGPHLWRTFLQIVPKGHELANVVATLARQEPDYIHKVLSQTIEAAHAGEDPVATKQALIDLMDELEEHEQEELFDDEDTFYDESDEYEF